MVPKGMPPCGDKAAQSPTLQRAGHSWSSHSISPPVTSAVPAAESKISQTSLPPRGANPSWPPKGKGEG